MYRITIDREACAGIFACLVRDDRFREAEDGLVTIAEDADGLAAPPGEDTGGWIREDGTVVATFEDDGSDRFETARQAAEACPPDAISVERIDDDAAASAPEAATEGSS